MKFELGYLVQRLMPPKWPNRVVVVRHGESEQNVVLDLVDLAEPNSELEELLRLQKETRDADVRLTSTGIWQAEQTGIFLATTEPFDVCYTSPYKRAVQTAEAIASKLPYEIPIFPPDNRLREKEFGLLHGLTTAEITERYPDEFHNRQRDGKYWYRPPGGDHYPDVGDRVHNFFDKLRRDHAGQNVLVVTHQVPVKMTRANFEKLREEEVLALENVKNCGMMELRINRANSPRGKLEVRHYNKVAY